MTSNYLLSKSLSVGRQGTRLPTCPSDGEGRKRNPADRRRRHLNGRLEKSSSCLLLGFNKWSGSVALGALPQNWFLDPQQQVVDACAVRVLISQLYQEGCFVWSRVCYFGLIARAPSLQNQKKQNDNKKWFLLLSRYASQAICIEMKSLPANEAPPLSAASNDATQSVLIARFRWRSAVFLKHSFISSTQSCHHRCRWRATWRSKSICGRTTRPTSWQRKSSTLRWQLCRPTAPSAPSSVPSSRYVDDEHVSKFSSEVFGM